MTNTLNQQPLFASLQLTDVLFVWQGAQSPGTRKMPVSALGSYYAPINGAVFTGVTTVDQLISTGGVSIPNGGLTVYGTSLFGYLSGYLAGMGLSNDVSSPNTVIDIEPGVATDSGNVSSIVSGPFTKATTGAWALGSGAPGMGNGLTITASTWYHVFAILNAGLADVYFDTSVTGVNAPGGTTAFRRIGSIKTDGAANILPFLQLANEFIWSNSMLDVNGDTTLSNSRKFYTLGSVPPGVFSMARVQIVFSNSIGSAFAGVSSPAVSSLAAATVGNPGPGTSGVAQVLVRTNQSQQVAAQGNIGSDNTITFFTDGWIDDLGRGII